VCAQLTHGLSPTTVLCEVSTDTPPPVTIHGLISVSLEYNVPDGNGGTSNLTVVQDAAGNILKYAHHHWFYSGHKAYQAVIYAAANPTVVYAYANSAADGFVMYNTLRGV